MKRSVFHIVLVVATLALALSCRGPKRISEKRMKDIYHDMFVLDQQMRSTPQLRRHSDSVLVYERVFENYGYTTDDFLYSLDHYMKDPERFSKLMEEVVGRLNREIVAIRKEADAYDWKQKYISVWSAPVDTSQPRPPLPPCDTVAFPIDSLWFMQMSR